MAKMKSRTLYYYLLSYKNSKGETKQVWREGRDFKEARKRAQDSRPVMLDVRIVRRVKLISGQR